VTNVVCQLEDITLPEVGLGQQAYVDPMSEKMIQFFFPVKGTFGIPAGQPQSFISRRLNRPSCHIRLQRGR
jgi:hypothetical protein